MSIAVMSLVWSGYPGGGSDLLALLALADWSDDNGRCFPSMAAVAKKTRLSRSQAQRVVHGLIDERFLSVTDNRTGGAPGQTPRYLINLDRLRGRANATGSADATGGADAAEGSHGCGETGRIGATQTVIEPSLTTKRLSRRAQTLQTFIDECVASGQKPIGQEDTIFDYAGKVGISTEMLAVCWSEFKTRHLSTSKTQTDWRAHYRNAVRRNWYGLWFLKEGESARWTTAGEQARRVTV